MWNLWEFCQKLVWLWLSSANLIFNYRPKNGSCLELWDFRLFCVCKKHFSSAILAFKKEQFSWWFKILLDRLLWKLESKVNGPIWLTLLTTLKLCLTLWYGLEFYYADNTVCRLDIQFCVKEQFTMERILFWRNINIRCPFLLLLKLGYNNIFSV